MCARKFAQLRDIFARAQVVGLAHPSRAMRQNLVPRGHCLRAAGAGGWRRPRAGGRRGGRGGPQGRLRKRASRSGHIRVSHLRVSHLRVSHFRVSHLRVSHLRVSHLRVSHFRVSGPRPSGGLVGWQPQGQLRGMPPAWAALSQPPLDSEASPSQSRAGPRPVGRAHARTRD